MNAEAYSRDAESVGIMALYELFLARWFPNVAWFNTRFLGPSNIRVLSSGGVVVSLSDRSPSIYRCAAVALILYSLLRRRLLLCAPSGRERRGVASPLLFFSLAILAQPFSLLPRLILNIAALYGASVRKLSFSLLEVPPFFLFFFFFLCV